MQQIINFLLRNKNTLLYVFLLLICLAFTINSHSYHQSKYFNSASWITGSIYTNSTNFSKYFALREENNELLEENQKLRLLLYNNKKPAIMELDTANSDYQVIAGSIIKNSYSNPRNYITINKGENDGINQDMGVITANGVLGIIEHTSNKFATVQSILNTKSNINAKLKGTAYFGSLKWNTNHFNTVQVEDIPRLVNLKKGDTIVTGAMSSIFPENIPIGTISSFELTSSKSYYTIDVRLFNDMANIKNVYIIYNKNKAALEQLESEIDHGQ